jgi:hypothetical protein
MADQDAEEEGAAGDEAGGPGCEEKNEEGDRRGGKWMDLLCKSCSGGGFDGARLQDDWQPRWRIVQCYGATSYSTNPHPPSGLPGLPGLAGLGHDSCRQRRARAELEACSAVQWCRPSWTGEVKSANQRRQMQNVLSSKLPLSVALADAWRVCHPFALRIFTAKL